MATTPALRRVPTRTGRIALVDVGDGVPVVFWPSLFSDHRLYAWAEPILGAGWRALLIDGPGFGRSDPPRGEVKPEEYADAVIDVLDELGIAHAFVAGCSWGGQVALHAGTRHPARVSGVLAMNTPLGPSLGGHAFETIGTRWIGSTRLWGGGVARSMFSPRSRALYPERFEAFVSAFPDFDRVAASVTVRTVMTRFVGLAEVLPDLRVETTILMGAEDGLYPVERLRPIAQLAPAARLEIVPGCGHLAPLEAPDAVVQALRALSERTTHAPSDLRGRLP
jgi:3-oxoadipate enol-lactonase